jgi:hypothetical protein
MKDLGLVSLFIMSLLFSKPLFAQFTVEETEMMEIIKVNGAYIKNSVFLDTTTIKNMNLANSTSWRHLWVDKEDSIKNIKQIYDIRLKFDSKKEAVKFHKKYLLLNSEYSEKIKIHGINFEGAELFCVYKGGNEYNQLMEPYGYQVFCLLYIVDNYFVKQHITCLKEHIPSVYQSFVTSTINKIKK